MPEVSETRLNQTVKDWPLGQTLMISAGIQPGILMDKGGLFNMRIPGTVPTSTELLVFLDAETGKEKESASRDREFPDGEHAVSIYDEGLAIGPVRGYNRPGHPAQPFESRFASCLPPIPVPRSPRAPAADLFPTIGARTSRLAVLFSMNLLNYVDRYVFFSAGPQISRRISDFSDPSSACCARRS